MIFDKNTAKKTAELLLKIKAIKLQPEDPFTWASGWKSPIYCDNRMSLSHAEIRNYVKKELAALAKTLVNTQCSCKMNRSVLDNFVKAKALQQLIYAKVDDLGTTYNATSLLGVNTDIKVLSDFLAGTNSACGC